MPKRKITDYTSLFKSKLQSLGYKPATFSYTKNSKTVIATSDNVLELTQENSSQIKEIIFTLGTEENLYLRNNENESKNVIPTIIFTIYYSKEDKEKNVGESIFVSKVPENTNEINALIRLFDLG